MKLVNFQKLKTCKSNRNLKFVNLTKIKNIKIK